MNNSTTLNSTQFGTGGSTAPIVRNAKQEISSEEAVMAQEISSVEQSSLNKVFTLLSTATEQSGYDTSFVQDGGQQQNQKVKDFITSKDVMKVLNDLDYFASKTEVEQMIWEVNDSLNGRISRYEFDLMYKRCCFDQTWLEPRNMYNVVQFLMYLQNTTDQEEKKEKATITVEDTLELLYVRHGRQQLDAEIDEIFGEQKKTEDGQEKELTIMEYLTTIKKKDFRDRENIQREKTNIKRPDESEF